MFNKWWLGYFWFRSFYILYVNLTHADIKFHKSPPPLQNCFRRMGFQLLRFITQEICMRRKTHIDPNILLFIFCSFLFFILFSWSIIASIDILLGQLIQKDQEIRKLKNPQQGKSFITVKGREHVTYNGKKKRNW